MTSPSRSTPPAAIPAIILAAGAGLRLGEPKATRMALAAGCQPVVAVIRPGQELLPKAKVHWVTNDNAGEGMASSIRAGLAALPAEVSGALLLTVDQVRLETHLLVQLLDCFRGHPQVPVACAYAGTLGIPAIIPRRLFPALACLHGDQGAKGILIQEATLPVSFPGGADDLDRPEDILRLHSSRK